MKFDRLGNPILRNQAHHFVAFFIKEINFGKFGGTVPLKDIALLIDKNNPQDVALGNLAIDIAKKVNDKKVVWQELPDTVFNVVKD